MTPRKNPLLWLGLALLIVFALSGLYLNRVTAPAHPEGAPERMLARASHIYILFIGLVVLAASLVRTEGDPAWIRRAVAAGKAMLIGSAGLLVIAQFREHGWPKDRSLTLSGCILALAGGLFLIAKAASPSAPGRQ